MLFGLSPIWVSTVLLVLTYVLIVTERMNRSVIALLDHGPQVREFGRGISWPLGVNVAYRREVFDRVGLFDNRLGRKAGTLRNQAQRRRKVLAPRGCRPPATHGA